MNSSNFCGPGSWQNGNSRWLPLHRGLKLSGEKNLVVPCWGRKPQGPAMVRFSLKGSQCQELTPLQGHPVLWFTAILCISPHTSPPSLPLL